MRLRLPGWGVYKESPLIKWLSSLSFFSGRTSVIPSPPHLFLFLMFSTWALPLWGYSSLYGFSPTRSRTCRLLIFLPLSNTQSVDSCPVFRSSPNSFMLCLARLFILPALSIYTQANHKFPIFDITFLMSFPFLSGFFVTTWCSPHPLLPLSLFGTNYGTCFFF